MPRFKGIPVEQSPKPRFAGVPVDGPGKSVAPTLEQDGKAGLGSDWQNFGAGMGKSMVDSARGIAQTVADPISQAFQPFKVLDEIASKQGVAPQFEAQASIANLGPKLQEDQADANQRDKALLGTKAGMAGNITGYGLQLIGPGAAIKARSALAGTEAPAIVDALLPRTFEGAIKQGAATGYVQPTQKGDSEGTRLKNAAIGATIGGVAQVIPGAIGAGYQTIRGLIDPLTDAGQKQIIANALARFGRGGNLTPEASKVAGVSPTLAEATGNTGIANLQRFLQALPENSEAFTQKQLENNGARVGLLRRLFGDQSTIDAASQSRQEGTSGLYELASKLDELRGADASRLTSAAEQQSAEQAAKTNAANLERFKQAKATSLGSDVAPPEQVKPASFPIQPTPELKSLAQRPAMQRAMVQAVNLAKNQGARIGNPLASIRGIQYVKMALDQMLNANPTQSLGKFDKAAVAGIKDALMAEAEKISPEFATANAEFARLSQPINAMQTGQEILSKASSNQLDRLGNPALRPESFAGAVNNADAIAQNVTGFKGATAEKILSPEQVQALKDVSADLGRQQTGQGGGKAIGSNTLQNLASASMLDNVASALGSPRLAEAPIVQRLSRVLDNVYRVAGVPTDLKEGLTRVVLNPEAPESRAILAKITPTQRRLITQAIAPYLGRISQATSLSVSK